MNEDLVVFSSPELKDVVQDMRDLLSQSSLAFLIGAGCSFKAGLPLMPQLTEEVLGHNTLEGDSKTLLEKIKELFGSARDATIEDYMSEIVDLLSIADRRARRGATHVKVSVGDQQRGADELQVALQEIKQAISEVIGKDVDVSTHQNFVRAIHGSLQAGKAGRCVDYFVLNYDTLVEDALGLEQISYVDGFTGAATGWWKPGTFGSDGVAARVFKIHGSMDWCVLGDDLLPRRIPARIKTDASRSHVLIYPAATKYKETQRDPFAQLFHQMRQSLRPGAKEEMVLAICGYSFGDSHIDLEIETALYQSKGRLTLAVFYEDKSNGELFSDDDATPKKLKSWMDNPELTSQIRLYSNKGFFHAGTEVKMSDVPWWRFEILARLLGGER